MVFITSRALGNEQRGYCGRAGGDHFPSARGIGTSSPAGYRLSRESCAGSRATVPLRTWGGRPSRMSRPATLPHAAGLKPDHDAVPQA